jgi:hypothetical protein
MADGQPETGGQGSGPAGPEGTGTEPEATGSGPGTGTVEDPTAELAKWKAMARKNEAQAKANADAAARLAQIEESQKTEQQKLADRAEQAERRAAEAELKVLRAEVASTKGIPAGLAQRLAGETREDLEADADSLLTHLNKQPGQKPKPPPASAVAGNGHSQGQAPEDIFASLIRGG